MSYYDIALDDKTFTLGPVHKIERTTQDITLVGDDNSVIAIFDRSIIRSLVQTTEPVAHKPNKTESIKSIKPAHTERIAVSSQSPQPAKPNYQLRKNNDTHTFEVHVDRELLDNKRPLLFQYKDLIVHAIHDLESKKVYVEKGTLMIKRVMPALENEQSRASIIDCRNDLIKNSVTSYNRRLYELTRDVEFASLSQAIRVLSGADISPKRYWKRTENTYSPQAIQELIELQELIS